MLQYSLTWRELSTIGAVTAWSFCFRLFPGSINRPRLVEFLSALSTQVEGKLLTIWGGLKAHKSRLVMDLVVDFH